MVIIVQVVLYVYQPFQDLELNDLVSYLTQQLLHILQFYQGWKYTWSLQKGTQSMKKGPAAYVSWYATNDRPNQWANKKKLTKLRYNVK